MASLMLVNPRKRRKTRAKTVARRPARRRSIQSLAKPARRYRRNPSPRLSGFVSTMKEGAIGAAGAVATEVVMSKLPLPANLASGPARTAVSALASVGVGMLVSKFGNRQLGKSMAQGGVTVAMHSALRGMVAAPMGLSGYYDGELGYYDEGLGYMSSAPTFNDGMGFVENEFDDIEDFDEVF